jgi:N-acetylglucosaminyl-diphospho-decaprenol L-rhamnosyltransferase
VRPELERCLSSIDDHAGVPTKTILVDNASTDDTLEWVRGEHPDVTVIELPRNDGDQARQHGVERSRSPYTMFLDSDAALTSGALPTMVAALEEHPDWGLVAPKLVYDDGTLQLSCRRFPPRLLPVMRRPPLERFFEGSYAVRHHLMADADHDHARPVLYVISACMLFRTSVASAIGSFGSGIFYGPADADWCIRIRDVGAEVVYFPDAVVTHSYRRITQSRPVSLVSLRFLRDFVYFQWRYRGRRRELIRLGEELDHRTVADDAS